MGKFVKRIYLFATVAKLIAYFLIYQFIFTIAGQYIAYLLYKTAVEPVTYNEFVLQTTAQATQYKANGMATGILLSSLIMIAHLLVFKYVRINKGFLHEVKRNVLIFSTLFIGSMMVLFNIVAVWLGLGDYNEEIIETMLTSGAGIISMAIIAPILEELLFRGAIQGFLMHIFKNPWVGIVIASLLFGVIHGNPIQIFYATCIGIGFGWIYYRTGSLLPAIVGHIFNNSLAVASNLLYGPDSTEQIINNTSADITLAIVAAIFTAILAYIINKIQPAVPKPWHEASEVL
ncbi:MAG: CPBP family intramembrane metalloprotease [Bacteroidaceae bacterium]|nr:CPBP family intramembrane metalloprotease [Bacteroidaceae bacterium]